MLVAKINDITFKHFQRSTIRKVHESLSAQGCMMGLEVQYTLIKFAKNVAIDK